MRKRVLASKIPIHHFSLTTRQKSLLIQTLNEKDLHDWLYAINPLLAGQIR
jgi:kinesin family protein 1